MLGPDDIVAAPSFEAAEKAAKDVTERFSDSDPAISALVIKWPFEESHHARDLPEFAEYFGDWGDQPAAGGE